ncbi:GNAT family N-acetyltransferase [Actinoplanes sp. NPDC051411]|uniref:GNAT family N-acetyltransferase n=1 Tax=Actinoplanes sp. NPDC051411 TaxID=3155522 RepID=UPI0034182EF0
MIERDPIAGRLVRPDVESFVVLAGDAPVGYAQYWHANQTEGGIDLILAPQARGRGYGPDAARALADHLLGDLKWSRVTVDPAADNRRAIRAWEKAGFQHVGADGEGLTMERRS